MEDKVTIKIKYLSKDIDDLKYIDGKSDWIDLRSAETVEMKAGDFRLIPLGIAWRCRKVMKRTLHPAVLHSATMESFRPTPLEL